MINIAQWVHRPTWTLDLAALPAQFVRHLGRFFEMKAREAAGVQTFAFFVEGATERAPSYITFIARHA